jgi:hypothetical protein
VKILLVPGDLTRLAFQFFAPKHLVRAETFPPSFLATAAAPLFPCHDDDDVLLALSLIRHEPPRAKRQTLEAKTRRVDVAGGATACAGGVRARHGGLEAAQQARHAHLVGLRCVGSAAVRSSDAVSTTSSSRDVVRRAPRPRRSGVRPMVEKLSVGRVDDVPMARGRAETVCACAIILGVIMTGATCQPEKLGWEDKGKVGKKAYGLLGSYASLVCGGGMARIGCARRRPGDWWTRSQAGAMRMRALSGGYHLV